MKYEIVLIVVHFCTFHLDLKSVLYFSKSKYISNVSTDRMGNFDVKY